MTAPMPPGSAPSLSTAPGHLRLRVDDEALLRVAVALVWLITAVTCLHPRYRDIGSSYLARLGLGSWPMFVVAPAEGVLGVALLFRPIGRWSAALQIGAVACFTAVLAGLEPMLLVNPFGVLSKNLSFVLVVIAAYRLARESPDAAVDDGATASLITAAAAAPWLTEGLLPKILFQQQVELAMAPALGLTFASPAVLVRCLGIAQLLSGVLALTLRGRPLRALLLLQAAALVVLPVVVGFADWVLWVHPFGPFSKNLPILAATLVRWRRVGA